MKKYLRGPLFLMFLPIAAAIAFVLFDKPRTPAAIAAPAPETDREPAIEEPQEVHRKVRADVRLAKSEPIVSAKANPGASDEMQQVIEADLDAKFTMDGPASAESRKTEDMLRTKFNDRELFKGVELEDFECHAETCRGRIIAESFSRHREAIRSAFIDPSTAVDTGKTIIFGDRREGKNGEYSATMYLVAANYVAPIAGDPSE